VAQSGAAAAREGGKHTLQVARRKSEVATASLLESIADHPGASLGIAVGAGILIGVIGPAMFRVGRKVS
jgi:ElaB/YqjD/DUF883 family membrane-anchored ribosome-binding protein